MSAAPTRITPFRTVEVDGLGEMFTASDDKHAEFFAVEELQLDGRWLTLTEHPTRRDAEESALKENQP